MRILLFDDEAGDRESEVIKSLVKSLRELDLNLDIVYDINRAIDKLNIEIYDVIILDVMIPYKLKYDFHQTRGGLETGILFLNDIRNGTFGEKNRNTKIIVYTNYDQETTKKKINDRFKDIPTISKPFKQNILKIIKEMGK
jgi:CheY-like chemotaxis protein